jgi:DNA-binding NarL/FixJ family response regulator
MASPAARLPMAEIVRLGRDADTPLEIDLASARRIGVPVVVLREARRPAARLDALSRRERGVAELVAKGLRNREIARTLHIAESTVKDHVHHILEKLGMASRTELAYVVARR